VANVDEGLIFSVERVEVRWVMIVKEHLDHNSKESRDLRHELAFV
jgi:hypothetical protein